MSRKLKWEIILLWVAHMCAQRLATHGGGPDHAFIFISALISGAAVYTVWSAPEPSPSGSAGKQTGKEE